MANVTGAELNPIYQRLNQVPTYHPFEANAFSDWSMEAGDMVTMVRNGEEYKSPVHVARMVWKGNAPTVQISSTGNKEREPVSRISRKKYGRGSAGVRSQEAIHKNFTSEDGILHSELHVTESYLRTEFHEETHSLRSYVDITASHLQTAFIDEVNSTRSYVDITASHMQAAFADDVASMKSYVDITASHMQTAFADDLNSLKSYVDVTASHMQAAFTDDVNSLRGYFDITSSHMRTEFTDEVNSVRSYTYQTASSWEARVAPISDANGNITPASITLAINTAGSEARINANKIYLLGQTIADTIDAEYLRTNIADIPILTVQSMVATGTVGIQSLEASSISLRSSSGSGYSTTNLKDLFLTSIELRGPVNNVYSLYQHTANDPTGYLIGTFSRATTLTGVWGGTVAAGKTFVVTATPQGDVAGCKIYGSIVPDSSDPVEYTTSGNNHYVAQDHIIFTEDDRGDADVQILKKEVKISADLAYSDGYTTGYEEGAASGGTTTLTNTWNTGHLVVTASPQQETWERWLSSGTATWNGTMVSIPINALWGNLQQYSESTGWSASTDVSNKLQSKTFNSNGTKTPDSGYIGFSSVSVKVAGADADARFGASSGQYFIGAYDNVSGNLISGSNHTYKLGTSGAKVQVQKSDGTKYSSTPELTLAIDSGTLNTSTGSRTLTVTAGGNDTTATTTITDYSAGKNAVTVSSVAIDGSITYSSKVLTVPTTATASNNETKTVNLSVDATLAYNAGWAAYYQKWHYPTSGTGTSMSVYWPSSTADSAYDSIERKYTLENKDDNTVYLRYSGTTYAQLTHNKYYAGKAAVTLNNPAWNTTTNPGTSNTVTVSTSGRTNSSGTTSNLSKSVGLYLTPGSWSSNKVYVYMREGSTSGTARAQVQIDASSIFTSGQNAVGINAPTWSTTPASGITVSGNTATFKTNAPTQSSRQLAIYMSKDSSFSSHKMYVYASHTNNTAANRIARIQVDATSEYKSGFNANHTIWLVEHSCSTNAVLNLSGAAHRYSIRYDYMNDNNETVEQWVGTSWEMPGVWLDYTTGTADQGTLVAGAILGLKQTNYDGTTRFLGKWQVPSGGGGTSHSISENHAVASDLASLANNLGASGSSALSSLGTFAAAGGRNYFGIRVKCGSAVKYYYVRATT